MQEMFGRRRNKMSFFSKIYLMLSTVKKTLEKAVIQPPKKKKIKSRSQLTFEDVRNVIDGKTTCFRLAKECKISTKDVRRFVEKNQNHPEVQKVISKTEVNECVLKNPKSTAKLKLSDVKAIKEGKCTKSSVARFRKVSLCAVREFYKRWENHPSVINDNIEVYQEKEKRVDRSKKQPRPNAKLSLDDVRAVKNGKITCIELAEKHKMPIQNVHKFVRYWREHPEVIDGRCKDNMQGRRAGKPKGRLSDKPYRSSTLTLDDVRRIKNGSATYEMLAKEHGMNYSAVYHFVNRWMNRI